MKKILAIAALTLATSFAFAQVVSGQGQISKTDVSSGAIAGASNSGVTTTTGATTVNNITNEAAAPTDTTTRVVYSGGTESVSRQEFGTQVIKNTPSVSGPALTSSNDTCMGSTSGSANVPGIGIGFGTSWVDTNCKMLKNGRELWNMGMKAAAMALMCTDGANREALELTGFECPQTARDRKNATTTASASASNEPTDPIVRNRMGLPAIK